MGEYQSKIKINAGSYLFFYDTVFMTVSTHSVHFSQRVIWSLSSKRLTSSYFYCKGGPTRGWPFRDLFVVLHSIWCCFKRCFLRFAWCWVRRAGHRSNVNKSVTWAVSPSALSGCNPLVLFFLTCGSFSCWFLRIMKRKIKVFKLFSPVAMLVIYK